MVQPSSVDVRLDSLFRVFNNTRYTHIDPAQQQDELTTLVEPAEGEPFVLHPGEFVLGSTLETCTLPHDLAGRLEGKSSLGRLGLLTDTGRATPHLIERLGGVQTLVLECNHDRTMLSNGRYPPSLKRRVGGDFGAEHGDTVYLTPDEGRVHRFDEKGMAIR